MNGRDAGAIDFGEIGGTIAAQPDDGGGERRHAEPDIGQAEIDDEELGQRRRAADELDIGPRGDPDRPERGEGARAPG